MYWSPDLVRIAPLSARHSLRYSQTRSGMKAVRPGGFGTQYCAWHSATSYTATQELSFTNLPYMPDAGGSCGANLVQNGNDGWSIVEGHEYMESVTDPFTTAWWDAAGYEIGDKCAWTGLWLDPLGSWGSFAMQPEWDNNTSNCATGPTFTHGRKYIYQAQDGLAWIRLRVCLPAKDIYPWHAHLIM